jgi:APA family basic amino acid/polyamine antiporter
MSIWRTKDLDKLKEESDNNDKLKKSLSATDLILLGLGSIIGTGIFVVTGHVAGETAGPAIVLSFLISGFVCVCASLAYAELASAIPVSGGAYTYAYVAFGEIIAWVVGWNVLLVAFLGASMVAVGWSGYVDGLLHLAGFDIPRYLSLVPAEGGSGNILAIGVVLLISSFLIRGVKEATTLNAILVFVKVGAIFIFLGVAVPHIDIATHWSNFMPFGAKGVFTGASTVLLAYSGFDVVAAAAEETKNPRRDVPIGLIGAILISAVLYMMVSGTLTGIVNYAELKHNKEPIAYALRAIGSNMGSFLVATGAIAGMSSVLLMQIYGQSRVLFAMARDGMLPKAFCHLHKKFRTPAFGIMFTGITIAGMSGFVDIGVLAKLFSMSFLFVMSSASFCVMWLRAKRPDLRRSFKCPFVYVVSTISILACGYLFMGLFQHYWHIFLGSILTALLIYFVYSYRNSTVGLSSC